jgi:hypothetical protein
MRGVVRLKRPFPVHRIKAVTEHIFVDKNQLPRLPRDLDEVTAIEASPKLDGDTQRIALTATTHPGAK